MCLTASGLPATPVGIKREAAGATAAYRAEQQHCGKDRGRRTRGRWARAETGARAQRMRYCDRRGGHQPSWSGKGRRVVRQDLQRPEARPGAGRVGQSVGAMRGAAEQVSTEAGEEAREARPGHLGLGHGERRPLDHRKFNSAQKNMLQSQQEYMFRIIM
jgi:hypothetical protein